MANTLHIIYSNLLSIANEFRDLLPSNVTDIIGTISGTRILQIEYIGAFF